MLLTLNQVISQITTLGAAHLQIAATGVGDFAEWQAEERSYPLLWVFHETTSVGDRELVYSIRLVCADRVITGEEGGDTAGMEQEVLSDTLLILLDFLAYFQQQHAQSYKVITNASIDPFTERFNDRVAGNSVLIQIRQPFTWDACQIPQTGATIPPSVDGLTLYDFCDPSVIARLTPTQVACLEAEYGLPCADATVTQNGSPLFTVAAGATYPLITKLDGANNLGTFNAGTKTLSFTSAACSPVTFQINAVNKESLTSGTTFNLITKLDGVVNSGSYDAPTDTLSFVSTPPTPKNTAMLIKTGQTVSTFLYDDGYFEIGRATSVLVLSQLNPIGTYARFYRIPTTNIVCDFSLVDAVTGEFMQYDMVDVTTSRTIVNHGIYASTKVVSGLSGWMIVNRRMLEWLRVDGQNYAWNYAPFNFNGSGPGDYLLTNTVVNVTLNQVWMHYNYQGVGVYSQARGITESLPTMFCRVGNISEL